MGITLRLLRLILPLSILIFGMRRVESITSSSKQLSDTHQDQQESSHILVRQPYGATAAQTTTQMPLPMTTMSLAPQTSISVHTVVRNKPVYISSQTVSPVVYSSQTSKEADYSYTYEDISEAESTKSIVEPSTKPPRSFWNSQKATLDSRRLNAGKKYPSGYHKQIGSDTRTTSKAPAIEFKKRERPKFGASKKPFVITYKTKVTESTTVGSTTSTRPTTAKSVENSFQNTNNDAKYSSYKAKPKVETQASHLKSNDIVVGRIGELPYQQPVASPTQPQFRQEQVGVVTGVRSSKYDDSVHSAVAQQNYQQLPRHANPSSPPAGNVFIAASAPQSSPNNQQARNVPIGSASNSAGGQIPISTLLSRIGALRSGGVLQGLNPLGRNGGGGFAVNLGPVPDPITFLLKLLSLIPKPLLNLNSRLFFGIELGSSGGLVSGPHKAG